MKTFVLSKRSSFYLNTCCCANSGKFCAHLRMQTEKFLLFIVLRLVATENVVYYPAAYESLGCWRDERSINAIASAEGDPNLGDEHYKDRELAMSKCARTAAHMGNSIFAVQDGGKCSTSCNAEPRYRMYGEALCPAHEKGGLNVNNVYRLKTAAEVTLQNLGCWRDFWLSPAIPTLEGSDSVLDGNYHIRTEAIAKCIQAAYRRGFAVIALQDGGWCGSFENANETYSKYGPSVFCGEDGKGGLGANQVYQINSLSEINFSIRSVE